MSDGQHQRTRLLLPLSNLRVVLGFSLASDRPPADPPQAGGT